jgi:hypothetical protein
MSLGGARRSAAAGAAGAAFLVVALAALLPANACVIQGVDSGVCMEPEVFRDNMTFCRETVR